MSQVTKFVVQRRTEHSQRGNVKRQGHNDRDDWEDISYEAEHNTLPDAEYRVHNYDSRPVKIIMRTQAEEDVEVFQ